MLWERFDVSLPPLRPSLNKGTGLSRTNLLPSMNDVFPVGLTSSSGGLRQASSSDCSKTAISRIERAPRLSMEEVDQLISKFESKRRKSPEKKRNKYHNDELRILIKLVKVLKEQLIEKKKN